MLFEHRTATEQTLGLNSHDKSFVWQEKQIEHAVTVGLCCCRVNFELQLSLLNSHLFLCDKISIAVLAIVEQGDCGPVLQSAQAT